LGTGKGLNFVKVFTRLLPRSVGTCELAGFGAVAEPYPDLVEWDCGEYGGLRLPISFDDAQAGNRSGTPFLKESRHNT